MPPHAPAFKAPRSGQETFAILLGKNTCLMHFRLQDTGLEQNLKSGARCAAMFVSCQERARQRGISRNHSQSLASHPPAIHLQIVCTPTNSTLLFAFLTQTIAEIGSFGETSRFHKFFKARVQHDLVMAQTAAFRETQLIVEARKHSYTRQEPGTGQTRALPSWWSRQSLST